MVPFARSDVRVRIAPSPTGFVHLGTARTALFNWLFARHHGGKFILRIEDTDKERSKTEHESDLLATFKWLCIDWDEGPDIGGDVKYRQSERTDIYKKYLSRLLDEGSAYYCYCTKEELEAQKQVFVADGLPPKYSGHCGNISSPPTGRTDSVIRFRTPEVKVKFKDLVRGNVEFDTSLFGDIVIAKDLETPLYNFAVAVDDFEMRISHVIRGEDHLSNTPKQILLMRALKFKEPIYAHIPLILNPNKSKLSKRDNDASLSEYRENGYLPDAMVNFMALLGWHPNDNDEILSREELITKFDISRVQKSGAVFDKEKLDWLNGQYIKKLSLDELLEQLAPQIAKRKITAPQEFIRRVVSAERGRMKTLSDLFEVDGFFFEIPPYAPSLLIWKDASPADTKKVLTSLHDLIATLADADMHRENLLNMLEPLISSHGRGDVLWPLRAALSGKNASPDPLVIAEVLGREETLRRIAVATETLEKMN